MCFSHMRYSRKAGLQKGDTSQGSHSSAFIKMRHKVYGRLGHDSCKNNTFEEMAITDQAYDRCSFITVQCGPALELTCAMCSTGHQRSRLLALDKHSTTHTRAHAHMRTRTHTQCPQCFFRESIVQVIYKWNKKFKPGPLLPLKRGKATDNLITQHEGHLLPGIPAVADATSISH